MLRQLTDPSRLLAVVAPAIAVALGATPAVAADPAPFTIAPDPTWASAIEIEAAPAVPEGAARDGVYELLVDGEERVSDGGFERYFRAARKIVSASGVEQASEISFDFDPPHERLVIHHIRIVRDGRATDALRPKEIHVIQQESDLTQRIYNGTQSALAFLHDVRAGDVIDYAYSIRGRNPVLGSRFTATLALGLPVPVRRLRSRLIIPADRAIALSARLYDGSPEDHVDGKLRDIVWDRRDVPAVQQEDATPKWFTSLPRVEVTEYASWKDVAGWAVPLFEPIPPPSRALADQIEALRRAAPDDGGRLLAALRFVQGEVRYLGIELGPSSHRPQPPSAVLERRFGDCKDKSLLLVSMLRALGITAEVALVNPNLGRELDRRSPSPLAFNHVIVHAALGGREYWLDPTMSSHHGGLKDLNNPPYERALIVAAATEGLAPIPLGLPAEPEVEETEELDAHTYDGPATLSVTTTFRGSEADSMRREVESTDKSELSRGFLNYYAADEPSIVEAALPIIVDDPRRDALTIIESYRIPEFWKAGAKSFTAAGIAAHLSGPRISRRASPLAVKHPTFVTHEIKVTLPEPSRLAAETTDLGDDAVSLHCDLTPADRVVTARCRYKTLRDFVPASEVEAHLRLVDRMRAALSFEVQRASVGGRSEESWTFLLWIGGAVVGFSLIGAGRNFLRNLPRIARQRAFARRKALAPGEAASTAIRVRSRDEVERHVRRSKCACGARFDGASGEIILTDVLLGGRSLTSARSVCASCGQPRSLFFEISS